MSEDQPSWDEAVGMLEEQIVELARTIDDYRNEVTRLKSMHGTERVAELVTEGNGLRALVAEILDSPEVAMYAPHVSYGRWRERAGLDDHEPAVVTAGTEHLVPLIRDLAIPDEL